MLFHFEASSYSLFQETFLNYSFQHLFYSLALASIIRDSHYTYTGSCFSSSFLPSLLLKTFLLCLVAFVFFPGQPSLLKLSYNCFLSSVSKLMNFSKPNLCFLILICVFSLPFENVYSLFCYRAYLSGTFPLPVGMLFHVIFFLIIILYGI